MVPSKFKYMNATLGAPLNWDGQDMGDLPVWTDGTQCVSLWKMSLRERLSALLHGHIWLFVLAGKTQPPVSLLATKEALEKKK